VTLKMASTVLSKGCFYEVEYLLETLLQHDEDDSFIFRLSYDGLKFCVYIYPDYLYMVILEALPKSTVRINVLNWDEEYQRVSVAVVETFMERFMECK
jgi:hypothetical protein